MAFESDTLVVVTDPSNLAADFSEVVAPGLTAAGAVEVRMGLALTGQLTGHHVLSSRWESLGAWMAANEAMAARMAPGGELAHFAERYQIVQRMLSEDVLEDGSAAGTAFTASRYSFTGPPQGFDHAASLAMGAGANGIRIVRFLAAGEWTGHFVGAIYYDSLDVMPGVLAATSSDAEFVQNVTEAGGRLESRTVFELVA